MWCRSFFRTGKLLSASIPKPIHVSARAALSGPASAALLTEPTPHRSTSDEDDEQQCFYQFQPQRQELDCVRVCALLRSSDPNAAFSFFDQLTKVGFSHNISTYSAIVGVLSRSSGLQSKLDVVLRQLITSEDFDVFDLLDCLSFEVKDEIVVHVFDALVKVYVAEGMYDEAIGLFWTRRRGFFPSVFVCNFFMNQLIEHGKPEVAVSLYMQLKRLGVRPNDYMYTIVLKALCKTGDLEKAVEVFREMEEAGVTPNLFAYTTYIEGLCMNRRADLAYEVLRAWQKKVPLDIYAYVVVIQGMCDEMKLDRAGQVIEEMAEEGMKPDAQCYGALIYGYCKSAKLEQALEIHRKMLTEGIKTNCVIVSYILHGLSNTGKFAEAVELFIEYKQLGIFMDEVSYNIVLNAMCQLGKVKQAMALLEQMKEKNMVLDHKHYTTLINGYCLQGNMRGALEVLKEMQAMGLEPDVVAYNVLARGYSRAGLVSKVIKLLDHMETKGIELNSVTMSMVIEGLCYGGKVNEAEAFYRSLEEKTVQNCTSMVSGYCIANYKQDGGEKKNYVRKAYKLFLKLSEQGILVKKNCCFKLVRNICMGHDEDSSRDGDLNRALYVLDKMVTLDTEPTKAMYNTLIAGLCRAGNMEKAWDIIKLRGWTPNVIMFTCLIRGYLSRYCAEEALNLFVHMINEGIKPDVKAYSVLLDGYSKTELSGSSFSTNRAKRGLVDAGTGDIFRSILLDMKDRNVAPDVICYTVVINRLCKLGRPEEAEGLLGDMTKRGIEPDVKVYTALISEFCRLGNVKRAVKIAEGMHSEGIDLDVFLCSILNDATHKVSKLQVST